MKNKTNGPTDEQLLADIEQLNDAAIEADVERRINEQTDRIVKAINGIARATLIAAILKSNNGKLHAPYSSFDDIAKAADLADEFIHCDAMAREEEAKAAAKSDTN